MSDFLHKVTSDSNIKQVSGPLRAASDHVVSDAAQPDHEVAVERISTPEPSPVAPNADSSDASATVEEAGTSTAPAPPEATVSNTRTQPFPSGSDRADIEPATIVEHETNDANDTTTPELRTERGDVIENPFSHAPVSSEEARSGQVPPSAMRGVAHLTHIVECAIGRGPALQSDSTFEPTTEVRGSDDVRGQDAPRRITAIGPLIGRPEDVDRPETRVSRKRGEERPVRADRDDAPDLPARVRAQDSTRDGAVTRGPDVHIGRVDIYVEAPSQPAPQADTTTRIDRPPLDSSAAYLRHL